MAPRILEPLEVTALDAEFWDSFVERFWRTDQPVHLRFRQPPLELGTRDFFDVVVRASEEYRNVVAGGFLRMYVDGRMLVCGMDELLPAAADGDIEAYAERARAAVGGSEFTVILYSSQRFSHKIQREGRAFLAPLIERVGLPSGYADIDAFCGQYSRTPFGIHKDYAANFSYVVSGTKSMLFWPDEAFKSRDPGHPGFLVRDDYETFEDSALRIDARPGDMMFWPASYWHIAVSDERSARSDGAWPTTVNLALYESQSALGPASNAWGTVQRRLASLPQPPGTWDSAGAAMPSLFGQALEATRAAAASPELDVQLQDDWLRFASGGGYKTISREPVPGRYQPGDVVRLSPGSRILLHRPAEGRLVVASNGQLIRVRDSDSITGLVARLLAGEEVGGEGDWAARGDGIEALLKALWSFGALDVVPIDSLVTAGG